MFAHAGGASVRRTLPPSFYVAPYGNNSWTGLLPLPNAAATDGPFLTLAAAQTAVRASSTVKRVTVRAGTYTLGANLAFSSSDDGCIWVRYLNEAAVIDGASAWRVTPSGVTNLAMKGLTFQNFLGTQATGFGGLYFLNTDNLMFRWNTVKTGTGWLMTCYRLTNSSIESNVFDGQSPGNYNGIANAYSALQIVNNANGGSTNNTVSHNELKNIAAGGISFEGGTGSGFGPNSNNTVDRNYLHEVGTSVIDMGALYMYDLLNTATGNQITNNKVFHTGANDAGTGFRGIYMDNDNSNTTITGNLLYGGIGSYGIQLAHNNTAHNNVCQYNVFALSVPAANSDSGNFWTNEAFIYQGGGASNVFAHNIVYYYTAAHNPQWTNGGTSPSTQLVPSNNLYFSANSSTISNTSPIIDASPVSGDPQFTNVAAGDFSMPGGGLAFTQLGWTAQLATDQGPIAYETESILATNPNKVRNAALAGSVNGSPGTMPTNASTALGGGLTRTVVGSGWIYGMRYFDIRFNGVTATNTSVLIILENAAVVTALVPWTGSLYWALISAVGSMALVTSRSIVFDFSNSGTGYLPPTLGTAIAANPTAVLTRITNTQTTVANTDRMNIYLSLDYNIGASLDFTLRIAGPQIEPGITASGFQSTP